MRKRRHVILLLIMCSWGILSSAQTFEEKLAKLGIVKEEQQDWSEAATIAIPQPNCAYVNITNIDAMPTTKTDDLHAYMEVYDCNGNYFKKRVILNAQGNSTIAYPKKNISVDFCEDDWIGDNSTDISIGEWVSQDSYHLKAYYEDFLHGIATVGYKIYDQMSIDRGRIWERASEGSIKAKDLNENARCYSDGFPCAIYLNGEFYGIFSWQLKKSRENMNMKKSTEKHIHLDGIFYNSTIWNGTVDWTQFEVRNPKTLYTMDGEKYDGDNPQELIDETSPFYDLETDNDKTKANKQMTANVKHTIMTLSNYKRYLKKMEDDGATNDEMRNMIEGYFDVPGIIDYICFHYFINNWDGFYHNLQWFTYDGVKWFVAPYDLDNILGNHTIYTYPANWNSSFLGDYRTLGNIFPIQEIKKYYWGDITARYCYLRENGIMTPENIYSIVESWCNRIGESIYDNERTKWPNSRCYRETVLNPNWTTEEDWTDYNNISDYNSTTTYKAGDKCRLQARIWTATGETKGVRPYKTLGYIDNLERIKNWLTYRFELEDAFMGYTIPAESLTSYTLHVSNAGWATICVPFAFTVPDGLTAYTVTGTRGENTSLEKEAVAITTEANKPYLIKGTPGFYQLTGYVEDADESDGETYLVNRLMHGTYETTKAPVGSYVLQNQNGRIGFYPVNSEDITVISNRAWLVLSESKSRKTGLFFDEEETTGVVKIGSDGAAKPSTRYNTSGIQLQQRQKGLVIMRDEDGKVTKIMEK